MTARLGFEILEVPFRVEVEGSPTLVERIRRQTSTYLPEGTPPGPAIVYRVRENPPTVRRDGEVVYQTTAVEDLMPWLELDWYDQAIGACDGWVLHAASVEWAGRALVLAGPSGCGKTTLAWALLGRGAGYLSDECTALDARGAVGLSRPLSFLDGELPDPLPVEFTVVGYPFVRHDDQPAMAEQVAPPAGRVRRGPVPLAAVVLLRHAPDESRAIRRLGTAEALLRLWPLTLSSSPARVLDQAIALLAQTPVFALTTRDVQGALDDLRTALPV